MARYLVEYDATTYGEDEFENEDGETIYEDYEDTFSDSVEIEAESEDEARQTAYDVYGGDYDDFYIWSVERIED